MTQKYPQNLNVLVLAFSRKFLIYVRGVPRQKLLVLAFSEIFSV